MKKVTRIISWIIICFFSIVTILGIAAGRTTDKASNNDNNTNETNKPEVEENTTSAVMDGVDNDAVGAPNTEPTTEPQTEPVPEEPTTPSLEDLTNQMNAEIAKIPYDFNDMNQKQDWFIAYKEIINVYPKELQPKTIYEAYDAKELDLLFKIVQCEVGDEWDFDEKANVASVIFNRLHSGRYTSLTHVLTAPKQFSPYLDGTYVNAVIDEKTVLACEYVFIFGDTTNGCYGFQMKKQSVWNGWKYQFSDDTHHFYK